jgi:hypothetical protein
VGNRKPEYLSSEAAYAPTVGIDQTQFLKIAAF